MPFLNRGGRSLEKSEKPDVGLLLDIQLLYNQLTKTEKKIADYIMKNTNQVLFMSITELADSCKVAEASVYRFCRTIGVKGYQEFKMKLSLSMSVDEVKDTENAPMGDAVQDLKNSILENHINALKETYRLLKWEEVEKIVGMMERAKHIYFFGIGDSLLTAMEARNKFLRIMNKVICMEDPHMQAMTASMSGPDDLVFLVSYSGATKDVVYVAEILKEAGAKAVAITRFLKSPLMNHVDAVLLCGGNEGPLEGGSMAAKLSQLYIIDILFQEYYRRNLGISTENNQRTSKAVVEKLY
ncbi:MurR/RpiR family transcriptional regulator [bacterium C-53]|nr:MurR/RpiR family transcriptional regulator [Lachnospiraceae bacterium]NBI03187.1 MurR/RpiR family transcriptional regulator [Lachnospiraceae bacterium]RKJ10149.1 MurR/RpiR family transcriptional regulator [bacterium C-53]